MRNQQQFYQNGQPYSNAQSLVISTNNLNLASQQKIQSSKNLVESCKEFKFFQKEISPPISIKGTKFVNPFGSQSSIFQNQSETKYKQMKKIESQLKQYQKMKKEVITQTLTMQNEPFREKFNRTVKQEPSEWEELKKQRILQGKRELNQKFKVQKQAITEYLEGKKVDNKIIKHHKEVVQPNPVQRAHKLSVQPQQDIFQFTQHQQQTQTSPAQANSAIPHQPQRFLLQSQKQLMQQQEHEQYLKQFTAAHNAKKRPKSALIQMLDGANQKTEKKRKEIDPIKLKMKDFLEKFLKGEQQYFKILEDTSKKGQQIFQNGIEVSQKFFYDQIEPSEYQFNQTNDLKTNKRYRILRSEQFKLNLPQQNNLVPGEDTLTKKKLGKNPLLKHSFTKVIDEQLSKDEKFQAMENYENYDSENYYTEQIKKQRYGLEYLHQQMQKTKEGFDKNKNIPEQYSEFLKLVKQNNKNMVQIILDTNPKLINEAVDHLGQTALHWAAKRGYKKMSQILINKGANINALDLNKKTPLDLAISQDQTKTISLIKKEEAVQKMEKKINTHDDQNITIISQQDDQLNLTGLISPGSNKLQITKQAQF
ncbi:ankyrin repeat protein (macronuclear) [Tetrahymena thermophila SB210]|uniref:Ankyrin repeat protein n=1 Tax=Tetrahymena thermophila (strain SB210) TaxID=312017 RepID=Q22AR8_TETTS|nr:ankyrin repeat protein [Tetrahymena thermophila SB210]EAR82367.2 ankyrin repeat protein [Tetrahymena thermophila SB210]|eukprot:XP_001030030.2 ankyrin repeat protein [Tetrahymena thermophila SB210]